MRTKLMIAGLCALLAVPASHAGATPPPPPNILIAIIDDLGPDKVTSYGGDFPGYAPLYRPATVAIDTLAARGLRFKRAWATPMCSSTRASLQTGQQPFRTGIGTALGNNAVGLDPALYLNLADSFVANGYTTGLFGKHHIGTRDANGVTGYPATPTFSVEPHPALMGWDRFFGSYDGYLGTTAGYGYFKWKRVGWLKGGSGFAADENTGEHATDRTVDVALDWINSRTQPWLAMVALNAPHSGTSASSIWTYSDVDTSKYRTPALSCLGTPPCASPTLQVYQGLAEHADLAIERLLNNITAIDNTVVLLFGDNGTPPTVEESLFSVASRGKGSTYENGVRVPLIVAEGSAWRTGVAGTRIPYINREINAKVNTLDIYNTVHEIAFGPAGTIAGIDSSSFAVCLTVNDPYCGWTAKRYGYTETFPLSGVADATTKIAVSYGEDTMVACYKPAPNSCMKEAFYDTTSDPLETSPQSWTGIRAQRLRDRFTTLHTGTGSWAEPGGVVIPFCGAAVAACP